VVEGLDVVVAAPIGASDEVAELLLERFDEAVGGDIRMNCDACLYRIALPGRESAVGAPQRPHQHPDDGAP
jgi:sirohydrochlorin cobaltochelatase